MLATSFYLLQSKILSGLYFSHLLNFLLLLCFEDWGWFPPEGIQLPCKRCRARLQGRDLGCSRWDWAATRTIDEDEPSCFGAPSIWCRQRTWCHSRHQPHEHWCCGMLNFIWNHFMIFLTVDSEELNGRLLLQLVDGRPLPQLVPIWTLRSYLEYIKCCSLHMHTCISLCLLYLRLVLKY